MILAPHAASHDVPGFRPASQGHVGVKVEAPPHKRWGFALILHKSTEFVPMSFSELPLLAYYSLLVFILHHNTLGNGRLKGEIEAHRLHTS